MTATPAPSDAGPQRARGPAAWLRALAVYREPAVVRMLFLGFSAGLPLLLVFGTLSFWLREAGVDRTTIGFISWVALAYAFKWAWAPLVDRLPLPWLDGALGRRRSWLLVSQVAIAACLVGMALTDPAQHLRLLVVFALATAFASATQDIALDAYRIESAAVEKQAALAAAYQTGYRLAMIWAGAGALAIAARFEVPPLPRGGSPLQRLAAWLGGAVVSPFADFVRRYRWHAVLLLALIASYRMSDVVMGVMANPFYRDMGFTKDEVAAVSKVYGVAMTLAGAFIGGVLSLRFGVLRTLFAGAVLSAATNLLFAWLATRGHDLGFLVFAVSADNLSAGIASSAFVAYLSGLTNVAYSATQYALFSSVMLLLPKYIAGWSGWAVDQFGYVSFFIGTALLGLPVLLLVWLAARAQPASPTSQDAAGGYGSPSQ